MKKRGKDSGLPKKHYGSKCGSVLKGRLGINWSGKRGPPFNNQIWGSEEGMGGEGRKIMWKKTNRKQVVREVATAGIA